MIENYRKSTSKYLTSWGHATDIGLGFPGLGYILKNINKPVCSVLPMEDDKISWVLNVSESF